MELILKPYVKTNKSTISKLYVDGVYDCDILEDTIRTVKKYGETCIPAGRYEITITMSNRFKRLLPLLNNVPGYAGIRIHPGNKPEDTEGCLLPGVFTATTQNWVSYSVKEFNELLVKINQALKKKEKVFITITR